jgi:hypothetical protein
MSRPLLQRAATGLPEKIQLCRTEQAQHHPDASVQLLRWVPGERVDEMVEQQQQQPVHWDPEGQLEELGIWLFITKRKWNIHWNVRVVKRHHKRR